MPSSHYSGRVGKNVGSAVGGVDAPDVGDVVGCVDGHTVGTNVSPAVGIEVGELVGPSESQQSTTIPSIVDEFVMLRIF